MLSPFYIRLTISDAQGSISLSSRFPFDKLISENDVDSSFTSTKAIPDIWHWIDFGAG